MFYSDNFTFNNVYSRDHNIYLVTQDTGILNEYGLYFNKNEDDTNITLSFCYADEHGNPLEWDCETLKTFLDWMITDEYHEFISEDNSEIIYFLQGVEYKKNFTNEFKGLIEITFKALSPFGYKYSKYETNLNEKTFDMYNYSNYDNSYKPVITLKNISSDNITITNHTTGKTPLEISNLYGETQVYIDNKMGTITGFNGNNLINHSNRSWIELAKGENYLSVEGSCTVLVEAYYPIMV